MPVKARAVRVLLIDDDDSFRVGLASVLAAHEDLEVVAQASEKVAIRLGGQVRPDVILMGLGPPDVDAPAAIRAMLKRSGSVPIVVFALTADEWDIAAAVDAGARGYLLKDSPIDDVVAASRAAASGTPWLSQRAARALLDRRHERNHDGYMTVPDDDLSPREIEVVQLLARGLHNHEIATQLSISPAAVNDHVSRILSKLVTLPS